MAGTPRKDNRLPISGTGSSGDGVRTLVVSWHWPPTSRASAGVLGSLFSVAPPGQFRVVTRSFPNHKTNNARAGAPDLDSRVPPTYVPWPLDDQAQPGIQQFLTVVQTVIRMVRIASTVGKEFGAQRVCAVYPHRLSLLAGWLTARRLRLPLVIYMHDLLAEAITIRNPVRRAFWKIVDRVVLRRAWMVMVPTREFAEHYRKRGISRTWVLPHTTSLPLRSAGGHPPSEELREAAADISDVAGWHARRQASMSDYAKVSALRPDMPPRLHLMYAGAIYEPHADAAQAFIAATESITNLRVTYLAPPDACGGLLGRVGARWLDHRDAMKELSGADVFVVLLGCNTSCPEEVHGCFPSKIIDYLCAARPILAVVPQGCFVDRLVSEYGCGVVARDNSSGEIRAAIERLRDPQERLKMSQAASHLARRFQNETWMNRMMTRLREGPEPATQSSAYQMSRPATVPTKDASFQHCLAD